VALGNWPYDRPATCDPQGAKSSPHWEHVVFTKKEGLPLDCERFFFAFTNTLFSMAELLLRVKKALKILF
jgi:hypothetical protein